MEEKSCSGSEQCLTCLLPRLSWPWLFQKDLWDGKGQERERGFLLYPIMHWTESCMCTIKIFKGVWGNSERSLSVCCVCVCVGGGGGGIEESFLKHIEIGGR